MIKYNLEKQLKDNWLNTTDTFSFIEKWVSDKKSIINNENLYNYKDFKRDLQFAGYDKEEVSVSYENDYLTIVGNSSMLNCQYSKKFYLPTKYYDVDNINVKFEKCILTIDCKLKEDKESKVMKIKIN
jgi:HSP20 family molecular chaperone IbpA